MNIRVGANNGGGVCKLTIDAIQGHAGKTAGDGYGDVTIIAKASIIDALPDYDLAGGSCRAETDAA